MVGWGWAGIGLYVLVFDRVASRTRTDTLTAGFDKALDAKARWLVAAAWTILTAHLYRLIPKRIDPFHRLSHLFRGPVWGRFVVLESVTDCHSRHVRTGFRRTAKGPEPPLQAEYPNPPNASIP